MKAGQWTNSKGRQKMKRCITWHVLTITQHTMLRATDTRTGWACETGHRNDTLGDMGVRSDSKHGESSRR